MENNDIIKELEKDIRELKQKGFKTYKIIEGLNIFGSFDIDLMVYIPEGMAGFNKSYRTIKFKSKNSRDDFLKLLKKRGLKWNK